MVAAPRARKRPRTAEPTGASSSRQSYYSGQDSQEYLAPSSPSQTTTISILPFLLPPPRPYPAPTPAPAPSPESYASLASSSKLRANKKRAIGVGRKRQGDPTDELDGFPQRFQQGTDGSWSLDDCWDLHGRTHCPGSSTWSGWPSTPSGIPDPVPSPSLTSSTSSSSSPTSTSSPSPSTTTITVDMQSLPRGWQPKTPRTNLYKVPAIVTSSVALAIFIIAVIVLGAHRRTKRRAGIYKADMEPDIESSPHEKQPSNSKSIFKRRKRPHARDESHETSSAGSPDISPSSIASGMKKTLKLRWRGRLVRLRPLRRTRNSIEVVVDNLSSVPSDSPRSSITISQRSPTPSLSIASPHQSTGQIAEEGPVGARSPRPSIPWDSESVSSVPHGQPHTSPPASEPNEAEREVGPSRSPSAVVEGLPPAYGDPSVSRNRRRRHSIASQHTVSSANGDDEIDDSHENPRPGREEAHVATDDKAVLAKLAQAQSQPTSSNPSAHGRVRDGISALDEAFDMGGASAPDEETLAVHEHEALFPNSYITAEASPHHDSLDMLPPSRSSGSGPSSPSHIPSDSLSSSLPTTQPNTSANHSLESASKLFSDPLPGRFHARGTVRRLSISSTRSGNSSIFTRGGAAPAYDGDLRLENGDGGAMEGRDRVVPVSLSSALPEVRVPQSVVREYERLARGDGSSSSVLNPALERYLVGSHSLAPGERLADDIGDDEADDAPSAPPLEELTDVPSAPPIDDLDYQYLHEGGASAPPAEDIELEPEGEFSGDSGHSQDV